MSWKMPQGWRGRVVREGAGPREGARGGTADFLKTRSSQLHEFLVARSLSKNKASEG